MSKHKNFINIFIALTLLCTSLLAGCGSEEKAAPPGKTSVVVSFNAMKELVQAVGQDKVAITTLIPDGTEPHDFQPTPKDMKALHKAALFVYNGAGMESWTDTAIKAASNEKLQVLEASKGITLIELDDPDEIKEHGQYDPHTWLSLANAQIEVKNIADALSAVDPKNKDFYQKNAQSYNKQLAELLTKYQGKFAQLPQKNFVTGHAAFAYLCRDLGLTQNSVEDVFASGEPSAQSLAQLAEFCKEKNVKTIFVEDTVSPKTSLTLAKEVGAGTQPIHTLESSTGTLTISGVDGMEQPYPLELTREDGRWYGLHEQDTSPVYAIFADKDFGSILIVLWESREDGHATMSTASAHFLAPGTASRRAALTRFQEYPLYTVS